jgi:iron complex transport system substrate-binding protein
MLACAGAGICNGTAPEAAQRRTVVDMAGRSVSVPGNPRRVVTVRGAPILNTFIFALGKGGTIVNGLPVTARRSQKDCCRLQSLFAPQITKQPSVEAYDEISVETILLLRPDLIFTMMKGYINLLGRTGVPVLYIDMGRGDRTKDIVALLGRVWGMGEHADRYARYFDSVVRRVTSRTSDIPKGRRVRVLYCDFRSFKQSSSTADWWIEKAGGISLGKKGPVLNGVRTFSAEDVLAWDPDVVIVSTPKEVDMVYDDQRFRNIPAVMRRRVVPVPTGSLRWSHPTSEQPLMLLWAAKLFYPERFRDLNIRRETDKFYRDFFGRTLSDDEIMTIFTGREGPAAPEVCGSTLGHEG